jgi:hypothetical protein
MMRVTDLEKFALEEVWRPYQNMMGYEQRLARMPVGLEETARLLRADTTGWSKRVIDRIEAIGITFPDYIQHPLVDVFGGGTKSDGGVERRHAVFDGEATRLTRDAKAVQEAGVAPGPSDAQEPEDLGDALERQGFTIGRPSIHSKLRGALAATPEEIAADKTLIGAQEPEAVALKPCPFCKASPHKGFGKVHHDQLHGEPQQDFSIWCPKGHAKVTRVNAGQAAEEWNTRPVSLDRDRIADLVCNSFNGNMTFDECADAIIALIGGRT